MKKTTIGKIQLVLGIIIIVASIYGIYLYKSSMNVLNGQLFALNDYVNKTGINFLYYPSNDTIEGYGKFSDEGKLILMDSWITRMQSFYQNSYQSIIVNHQNLLIIAGFSIIGLILALSLILQSLVNLDEGKEKW